MSAARNWLVIAGLALGPAVTNGFARFAYGQILPAMRDDLAWNFTQAGWVNTANAVGIKVAGCGQAATKPYCDGAHREAGFKATAGEIEFTS